MLKCAIQHGDICVWAKVDTEAPVEERIFEVYGTGWELDMPERDGLLYHGTVFTKDAEFVWHVFERPPLVSLK